MKKLISLLAAFILCSSFAASTPEKAFPKISEETITLTYEEFEAGMTRAANTYFCFEKEPTLHGLPPGRDYLDYFAGSMMTGDGSLTIFLTDRSDAVREEALERCGTDDVTIYYVRYSMNLLDWVQDLICRGYSEL